MRPDVPAPGTWRRDDGATSFLPSLGNTGSNTASVDSGVVKNPVVTAPVIEAPKPQGPEMVPCPYCSAFEYEAVEGVVPQSILDHLKVAHAAIWAKMQEYVAAAVEKTEEEFV
jgi:hypothetical protein